jgi:hypothetical protein
VFFPPFAPGTVRLFRVKSVRGAGIAFLVGVFLVGELVAQVLPSPQSPSVSSAVDRSILVEANRARVMGGSIPFWWDENLARIAEMAVERDFSRHEQFTQRIYASGVKWKRVAEGVFPGVWGREGVFRFFANNRWERHSRDFFDKRHTRFGAAYGGKGSDGRPFWVFVYAD